MGQERVSKPYRYARKEQGVSEETSEN